MSRWSSSSSKAMDESMRVEVDVKLREKELSLLQDLVEGARSLTPIVTDLGVLSKLVLAGAGGLVCLWGLSAFVHAVVLPFRKSEKEDKRRARKKEGDEQV